MKAARLHGAWPAHHPGCGKSLREHFEVINHQEAIKLQAQAGVREPVTLAALAHHQLVAIHPFIDGNGRTARLILNLI